jgi:type IV pilus assembly protein PilX
MRRQQGVSLLTVMVVMLLGLLMVLGSSRVTLLNEKMAGNSTDYQRAYEAAEALLSDARLDLACLNGGCITRAAVTQFTCDVAQFGDLQAQLATLNPPCRDGICLDLGTEVNGNPATSFWNNAARFTTFTTGNRGVRFGQYTNSPVIAANAVNPLLVGNGWYWIEILPYGASAGGRSVVSEQSFLGGAAFKPDKNCEYMFRVTAVAQGRKPGTSAVLQSLYFFRPA